MVEQQKSKIMWWGYLHQNGKPILKRWFGDSDDYTTDCYGNPFVLKVVPPFEAEDGIEAMEFLIRSLNDANKLYLSSPQ